MMELISGTNFDFLGKAKYFIAFSTLTIIASFYIWFARGEEKYDIDFTGGHEVVVRVSQPTDSGKIRSLLEGAGLRSPVVQAFEVTNANASEYSIRLPASGVEGSGADESKAVREKVSSALKGAYNDKFEILKSDFVGPTVGKELRGKALIALLIGLAGILIYVSFRFELAFGVGAVVALFHDVIVCIGVYLWCGKYLNVGTLAAALTIVGYSVNDTIVIFDRVREEILKHSKSFDLHKLINECVNATLSRTIITSLLTFFSALALLIFGGGAIEDLSLCMVAGIVAGSYSTIFIASPVALAWERFRSPRKAKA